MRLFAQHGAQEGEKLNEGIRRGLIDGVVYSPRDISLENLNQRLTYLQLNYPHIERLLDPQYYVCFLAANESARLGYLSEIEHYRSYCQPRRRGQLEREQNVIEDLRTTLDFQRNLEVSAIVAPNIVVHRSFDSIEGVIAKNFIRNTATVYSQYNDTRPIYATIAMSRDAITNRNEVTDFLNEITAFEHRPQGFYVLISARSVDARSEIYNADVIAAWMFINYTLSLNGFEVINGYSDILTPFLGVSGAKTGCTGWWENLRMFSLERFEPSRGGGRLPNQRYLSARLLNRIIYYDLNALRTRIPEILNGLELDNLYNINNGSEPQRNQEILQTWEAIRQLNSNLVKENNITQSLQNCLTAINQADDTYALISSMLTLDSKSNREHLDALREGIILFKELAEI